MRLYFCAILVRIVHPGVTPVMAVPVDPSPPPHGDRAADRPGPEATFNRAGWQGPCAVVPNYPLPAAAIGPFPHRARWCYIDVQVAGSCCSASHRALVIRWASAAGST